MSFVPQSMRRRVVRWPMDPHRITEARSLAYHQAIAERLDRELELITRAIERVERWRRTSAGTQTYLDLWLELLQGPRTRLLQVMLSGRTMQRS